jgi:hypothetical protein
MPVWVRSNEGLGLSSAREDGTKFFNGPRLLAKMQDGVAVWTDRTKVRDWVDLVLATDRSQRNKMVDMSEPLRDGPVDSAEVELADCAGGTVMAEARLASARVSLVRVHKNSLNRPFYVGARLGHFLGQGQHGRRSLWVTRLAGSERGI